jgi:DNA invertase Pin-like site-specific DNA recombinase/regulator of replication initiation timing
MNIAIYGRKSVFSEKSDSIDNQFRMCQEYSTLHLQNESINFMYYSDEDFTGANTKRPDLQRLISDIENQQFEILIVYQLDRLSRDVRDFSNIYAVMEEHGVKFISIKENIDTTTPIGRAMMYVTVVFAQMERETIAARVTDNMIGLAKKGYWTGGNPPYGYVRCPVIVDGKKHVSITPDPEGVKFVRFVFDTFLSDSYSLQSLETFFRKQGIRTPINNKFFSTNQLHKILTMPYCVEATPAVYDFYEKKGCIMDPDSPREKWSGKCGVIIYGRTTEKNKKHQLQPADKWLVTLGIHDPFISADIWLAAQARFTHNVYAHTMKYEIPLLKGSLRCSCGSLMCVSRKKLSDGRVSSAYYCIKRMRQGDSVCNSSQIKISLLDDKLLSILNDIKCDPSVVKKYIPAIPVSTAESSRSISAKITACESKIGRLTTAIALNSKSSAVKYMISELERLDLELSLLKRDLSSAKISEQNKQQSERSAEDKAKEIIEFAQNFDNFSATERNSILRNFVSECVWNGSTLSVTF